MWSTIVRQIVLWWDFNRPSYARKNIVKKLPVMEQIHRNVITSNYPKLLCIILIPNTTIQLNPHSQCNHILQCMHVVLRWYIGTASSCTVDQRIAHCINMRCCRRRRRASCAYDATAPPHVCRLCAFLGMLYCWLYKENDRTQICIIQYD